MFARVASFEGGDTGRLRQMSEELQASGSMSFPAGVRRALVLNDDETGRRLFITFFDSREELAEAETQFDAMGAEIPEEIGGHRTALDVYEVMFDAQT